MTEDAAVIYVVDDDKATRHALSSLLRSIGFLVVLFESADDFLKTDFQDVPGCLVLDVRMPGLSGLDLQSRIMEMGLELPLEEAFEGNAYTAEGSRVPSTLRDALDLWLKSELAREAFGSDVVEHYANAARVEITAFDAAVTDWELQRGFERM